MCPLHSPSMVTVPPDRPHPCLPPLQPRNQMELNRPGLQTPSVHAPTHRPHEPPRIPRLLWHIQDTALNPATPGFRRLPSIICSCDYTATDNGGNGLPSSRHRPFSCFPSLSSREHWSPILSYRQHAAQKPAFHRQRHPCRTKKVGDLGCLPSSSCAQHRSVDQAHSGTPGFLSFQRVATIVGFGHDGPL